MGRNGSVCSYIYIYIYVYIYIHTSYYRWNRFGLLVLGLFYPSQLRVCKGTARKYTPTRLSLNRGVGVVLLFYALIREGDGIVCVRIAPKCLSPEREGP